MRYRSIPIGNNLKRPIIFSAIVHLALFLTFVFAPGIYIPFVDRPMRIDVMWVELPRGTSEEIGLGLKEAEGLPKSTIEEQKKIFQPEPTKQSSLDPEMKAPPENKMKEPVAKKNEKRPEIDTSKMKTADKKAKPVSRTDKKIRDALAKIDKQLSGRQVTPEASQVGARSDGYKYGTGDKPLRVMPSDPEYLKYQAMVRAKIIREWIVPGRFGEEGGGFFNAQLEVMINMDGDVISTRWQKASGNTSFDQSAVRAVRQASPFPKPPDRLAWEAYNEGFLIEFDPRLKPQ